jgi:xanthine dehydrogenase YagS FAD-binding subunit
LLSGASAQLRNMATTGGNLLQRTRCVYFRDTAAPCNKREPGSGCAALDGFNRSLAILGTSENCIASNPSDMNVALAALEATVQISGAQGSRSVELEQFHLLPGDTPWRETVLEPGDLVTSVTLPAARPGSRSIYLKLRDRASYEFALASAAVVAVLDAGRIASLRIALGGVATRPWRAHEAEAMLQGAMHDTADFRAAAEAALQDAKPRGENGFKVELAKRCLVQALKLATQTTQAA